MLVMLLAEMSLLTMTGSQSAVRGSVIISSHSSDLTFKFEHNYNFFKIKFTKKIGEILYKKDATPYIFGDESGVEYGADRVLPQRHPLPVGPLDQVEGEGPRLLAGCLDSNQQDDFIHIVSMYQF